MSECPNCHTVFDYIGDMQTAIQRLGRAEAEIDRLRAELEYERRANQRFCADALVIETELFAAEARLAAVLAALGDGCSCVDWERKVNARRCQSCKVRAAAEGETK